jgi:hypothetical protein
MNMIVEQAPPVLTHKGQLLPAPQSRGTQSSTGAFLREYWPRILGISAAIVLPCFWHTNIEAGDLASHTYNAWLVQLIQSGQAPGLWLARQSTNILFDLALSHLGALVGLRVAEKLLVATVVLCFFWGAFALVCAFARRVQWFVLPCLAMLAYGWTFETGLLNNYISLGLSFWALAIFVSARGWKKALALTLCPLIWMAHPSGIAFVIPAALYIAIAEKLPLRRQIFLVATSALILLLARLYLMAHYPAPVPGEPFYTFTGLDQLMIYGFHYLWPAVLLFFAFVACLVADANERPNALELVANSRMPLQLYVVTTLGAWFLPNAVGLSQYSLPQGLIAQRVTTISGVLLCCVIGVTKFRKWVLVSFASIAAIFFFFLFQDTATLNRMETQAQRYERVLPPGERVISTIFAFPGSRIQDYHLVDRSCLGYCFSYENYEASTRQFRIRAHPDNPIVTPDYDDSAAMKAGLYVVQPQDLPVFQIYQCKLDMIELCMRELPAGETNGKYGLHPVKH